MFSSPFKSWNRQQTQQEDSELRKDGERLFEESNNTNNNAVTYKARLMTFFGRRKKKTTTTVPPKKNEKMILMEKHLGGNNDVENDRVGSLINEKERTKTTTQSTEQQEAVKKPTQKRAQKLKDNVQKSKEENAANARLREQRDYFDKIDKMSSLQSEKQCSPLPAVWTMKNNSGRNMELSPLGVIKAVGGLEFDGVDAKKAIKETRMEQQQQQQAKDEEKEEQEEEFSFDARSNNRTFCSETTRRHRRLRKTDERQSG